MLVETKKQILKSQKTIGNFPAVVAILASYSIKIKFCKQLTIGPRLCKKDSL